MLKFLSYKKLSNLKIFKIPSDDNDKKILLIA